MLYEVITLSMACLSETGCFHCSSRSIPAHVRRSPPIFPLARECAGSRRVAGPAGEGPDIIIGAHDWLGELVTNGLLAPIDLRNNFV